MVFFDDILVYSKSEEEHIKHVAAVLEKLAENNLYVNFKKCGVGQKSVSYLGHVISSEWVKVDLEKVKSMMDWPRPRNLRELRGFLRLTGYYQKFIRNYAQIAQPLTMQLRKDSFGWSESACDAFEKLKAAMV